MSNTPPVTSSFEINIQSLVDGLAKAVKVIQEFQDKVSGSGFKVPLGPSEQEFAKMQAGFKGISDGIGKLLNDFSALSASASSSFANASQQATNLITEIAQANDVAKELADNVKKTQGGGKKDATEGIFGKFPTRDEFLAILGASKLIGGEVGQIIRGLDFMAVGAKTFGGALIGGVGLLADIAKTIIDIGIEESKTIVQEKAKADAIGLSHQQYIAVKKTLEESGRDIGTLNQGFRNISEALEGVGKNSNAARANLEAMLGRDITSSDTTFTVLKSISEKVHELIDSGHSAAGFLADVFGRGSVEAAGGVAALTEALDANLASIQKLGLGSKESEEQAKKTVKAISDIEDAWRKVKESFVEPVSVVVKIAADISPALVGIMNFLENIDPLLNVVRGFKDLGKQLEIPEAGSQDANGQFAALRKLAVARGGSFSGGPFVGGPTSEGGKTSDRTAAADQFLSGLSGDKAEREKTIALKEQEIKDLQKQQAVDQLGYDAEKKQLDAAAERGEDIHGRQVRVDAANRVLLADRLKKNTLDKELAELKKNPNIAIIDVVNAQVEDIREEMSQLNPLDDKFLELGDKKHALLLQAAGLVGSSGEDDDIRKETALKKAAEKERVADLRKINTEIINQIKKELDAGKADIQQVSAQAEEIKKEESEALKQAFSTGKLDVGGLLTGQVGAIQEALDKVTTEREKQKAKIDADLQKLQAIQGLDGFTPKMAEELTALEKRKKDFDTEGIKDEQKSKLELIKVQEDAKKNRLAVDDELRRIELQALQGHNKEILAEEAREAEVSLNAKEKYMKDKLALAEQEAKQELDNLLNSANEQANTVTNILRDASGKALGGEIITPDNIKNASKEQIQSILDQLNKGKESAPGQLKEYEAIIGVLEKIVLLRQQEKFVVQDTITLEEKNVLTILDEQIKRQTILLNLQEQRNKLLDSFGKLTPEQVRRQQAAVSAERISLNDAELSSLAQKFSVAMADAQRRAPGASQAELFRSNPELSKLNDDMLKLASTNALLRTSFELTNSVLGVLASNLDDLANKIGASAGPLKGLAPAVKGLSDLVKLLDKANVEKNDPATKLKDGGDYVYKSLVAGADYFRDSQIEGGNGQSTLSPAANKAIVDTHAFIKQAIGSLAGGLAGLVQGLGASTTGGRVSGFGGGLGSLLGLAGGSVAAAAPVVGIVANIAGSIIDTIGNIWKERAQKIANNLENDFKAITAKFQEGTISLGQTINDLNAEMSIARDQLTHGKIGKKGGNAQFQAIQQQVGQQIAQLQLQAQQTQNDFLGKLQDLRSTTPASIGTRTSIDEAISQVRKFLNSFDSASTAAAHMGEAQEFLATTLGNMKTQLDQQISDQINQQNASARAFAQSEKNIIDSGRVQTQFQSAQNKVQQLFEQEANRALQVQQQQRSMKALTDQADALSTGFDRVSKVLNRIADQLEAAFTPSAEKSAGVGVFAGVTPGSLSASAAGLTSSLIASSTSSMSFSANISIASGSAQEAAGIVGDEIESRLAQLGITNLTTGRINRSRPFQP